MMKLKTGRFPATVRAKADVMRWAMLLAFFVASASGAHHSILQAGMVPLDLTFVAYFENSLWSLVMALTTLFPLVLLIVIGSIIIVRRELEVVSLLAGLGVNGVVCLILKRLAAQRRPIGSFKQGYGMPSHHSQFMLFFCVFVVLVVLKRQRVVRKPLREAIAALVVVVTGLVSYSRVHLGVHTNAQIAVGALVGAALGALWFAFVGRYVRPWYRWLEDSQLGRAFQLRDSMPIDGLLEREHELYLSGRDGHTLAYAISKAQQKSQ